MVSQMTLTNMAILTAQDLGYNEFLQKRVLSPVTRITSSDLETMIPYGGISLGKMAGDTLSLGGSGDKGGKLSVLDSTGTERVLLDSDGITVTDGKITIKDDDGSTVIDSYGIVSGTTFVFDSVVGSGTQTTTGDTNYHKMTGITLTFTLARATQVLILLNATGYISGDWDDDTARTCAASVYVDDQTVIDEYVDIAGHRYGDPTATLQGETVTLHTIQELSSGEHTIDGIFGTSTAAYTAGIFRGSTRLSYLVLGK